MLAQKLGNNGEKKNRGKCCLIHPPDAAVQNKKRGRETEKEMERERVLWLL